MFFSGKKLILRQRKAQSHPPFNLISFTNEVRGGSMTEFNNTRHLGPISNSLTWKITPIYGTTVKILTFWSVTFLGTFYICRQYPIEVTVNTAVTMTITRVSRTFPICQIWSLIGQNFFSWWSRQKVKPMNNFRFFWATRFFLEVSECFKNFNSKFWKKYRPLCSFRLFNWLVQVGVPNTIGS